MPDKWTVHETRDARILVAGLPYEVRRWGEADAVCYCQTFTEAKRMAGALTLLEGRERLRLVKGSR